MAGSSECLRCETAVPDGARFCHICGDEIGNDVGLDTHARLRERLTRALGERYRVLDLLGVGGMGVVFLADDVAQSRKVAIKVLSPELAADAAVVERFAREARTAAALEHPGIVRILGEGRERGLHYFVMQYIEGRSLQELLSEETRLPIPEATRILRDAAAALAHAHHHGVVHRDVKPENIMLDPDGRVMLTDFGISKVSRATSGATTIAKLTDTGGVIGTPHYMAPEHALGQAVDGRADQYALAVVGFQMLTGGVPFDDETSAAIIHLHINSAAPRLSSLRPDVPPLLAAALARAMSKAPAHRFATMEEFAVAVAGPSARRPLARALSAGLVLLLLGGAAGGAWWWHQSLRVTAAPKAEQAGAVKASSTKASGTKASGTKSAGTKSLSANRPPAASPAVARLSITSSPSATVFIDGRRIGVTPIAEHSLRSGRHLIRLERTGYRSKRDTLNVTAPRALRRNYVLQRERK